MLGLIQEIADNNLLANDVEVTSDDELGKAGGRSERHEEQFARADPVDRGTAEQVAASSEELSATSQHITANSEETTAQAKVVSEAGGQVNTNLQTLASGAEEMNSTIGEIAKNATEAARVAGRGGGCCRIGQSDGIEAGRFERRDRKGDRGDHLDRAADQPAGIERDH
jgi:methyl-accepting chemotaxis protein